MNDIDKCKIVNVTDEMGNPTGGSVDGVGLMIAWQDGPLGRGKDCKAPNGAFVETVIAAALQRLKFFEGSAFSCPENQDAIGSLQAALDVLERRTRNRERAGTEGTHNV